MGHQQHLSCTDGLGWLWTRLSLTHATTALACHLVAEVRNLGLVDSSQNLAMRGESDITPSDEALSCGLTRRAWTCT